MTDSMKFGPEWLRNLSADTTNPSNCNAGVGSPSNALNSSSLSYGNSHALANSSIGKNMFPEFRYGREEMLSLFDKNCTLPDILPSFKKIFVDKVQNPLALTPSTDEEISQGSAISSQRPTWIQRSPVGFSSALRGNGRGGSVERGRMRGKSLYHPNYPRPTALFEDDLRSIKSERAWSERNGAGDPLSGVFGMGSDWNGTPISSPRKEFSSHPRNLENWRRNRNDDGSGDATTGLTGSDGWRGSSTSGFNAPQRWGRSTSWRDDDGAGGIGDGNNYSGSGVPMQRSYSTIATTVSDRGNFVGSGLPKGFHNSTSFVNGIHRSNSGNGSQSQKSQWSNGGKNDGGPSDCDDNLPEWAMENPSDCGGTFDSSGAFLGSVDEDGSNKGFRNAVTEDDYKLKEEMNIKSVEREVHSPGSIDSYVSSPESQDSKDRENVTPKQDGNKQDKENDSAKLEKTDDSSDTSTHFINKDGTTETTSNLAFGIVPGDFSDRMKEVADDMVEKLIMDDDNVDIIENNNSTEGKQNSPSSVSTENNRNNYGSPSVVAILKETSHQHISNPVALSPSHPSLGVAVSHKMFGSGVMVDHVSMPHHHMQQQLAASRHSHSSSTEMWFYRDPQSKVQGPFNSIEMTEWYRAGYFNDNLYVRRICDDRFRALGDLIKICHGNMPFTHSSMIPVSLENLHVPNVSTIPQLHDKRVHDICLKVPSEHYDIKADATAVAESIIVAVKNLLNPMDVGNMLNMHFQMLQDKHIRSQEIMVLAQLSKNESFQQLPRDEQEAFVRQKVQVIGLPEYLTSLTALSNVLAALHPAAGQQLIDAMAECSKKGNIFAGAAAQPQSLATNFIDVESFILNAQHHQLQAQFNNAPPYLPILRNRNENNPDFNMHMFIQCDNADKQQGIVGDEPKSEFLARPSSGDFLADKQLLDSSSSTRAAPILQMWLPQIQDAANTAHQNPMKAQQQGTSQWTAGRLVGIPQTMLPAAPMQPPSDTVITPNHIPVSSWNSDLQVEHKLPESPDSSDAVASQKNLDEEQEEVVVIKHEVLVGEVQKVATQNKNCKNELLQNPDLQSNEPLNTNAAKQVTRKNKQPSMPTTIGGKSKEELKRIEEERRREQTEEKRKLKDEKKRQVLEDEKKKLQHEEEEKRRQTDEEKDRQQLIQAQRRKALLGAANACSPSSLNINTSQKNLSKTQHQSSVAPWSTQASTTFAQTGPCLADIQKAERRERRADQQRQLENVEKQMRANAVAEANEGIVKWNASIVPVKSFVEIQAEEAKRLAAEQLEMQRRKDNEQQSAQSALLNGGIANVSGNVQAIWGGTKVWSSTNTAGFWEEPARFSTAAAVVPHKNATTAAGIVAAGLASNSKQSLQSQASKNVTNSSRSLKKSQTVSVMQNTPPNAFASTKNIKANNPPLQQRAASSAITKQANKTQQQKLDCEKKSAHKNITNNQYNNTSNSSSSNKKTDDFENEFTGWCTTNLLNMNTKVDVPTFVQFLQDIESPFEVKDYIRMYLGETKEYVDFAKQFLERRSKYKNLQRAQNAHNDDMCKPAPAITPLANDNSDNKTKQKKPKKNKMTKLDARILGFSVTAASGRINVGDRDYELP